MSYLRKSPPRLSVEITEDQERKLRELLPHGHKVKIFSKIVDQLIIAYENEDPYVVTGAILKEKIRLK